MSSSKYSPTIIFDAVGTLIYARPTVAEVYHHFGSKWGWSGSVEDIQQRFSIVFGAAASSAAASCATNEVEQRIRWRSIVGSVFEMLSEDAVDRTFSELWEHFAQPSAWDIYPDAVRAIELCESRGWRWCIASNFDSRLRQVVAGHALLSRAEQVFCSSELGFDKPSMLFFRAIEQRLGLSAQQLVMVGDDQRLDLHGAQAAGWKALWIDRKSSDPYMQLHQLIEAAFSTRHVSE